jgi:hypothetical protein
MYWKDNSLTQKALAIAHETGHIINMLSVGKTTGGFVHADSNADVNAQIPHY